MSWGQKAHWRWTSCGQVDLDSSLRPRAGPQGPGAQARTHSLFWLGRGAVHASPEAPALMFILQTASCPTRSFRGQGVAAWGTGRLRPVQAVLGPVPTRAQSPFALELMGPPHPCYVQTRAREAAEGEGRGAGMWVGGGIAAGLCLAPLLPSPVTLSPWGRVPQFPQQQLPFQKCRGAGEVSEMDRIAALNSHG